MKSSHLLRGLPRPSLRRTRGTPRSGTQSPPRTWLLLIGLGAWAIVGGIGGAEGAGARAVAAALAPVSVRVSTEASVQGDEILLGELAAIDGDGALAARLRALRLGAAPYPGGSVPLTGAAIRARLRQAQIDPARLELALPERVLVTRAFQVVPTAGLIEAATREILSRLPATAPGEAPYALVPIGRPDDLRAPTGRLELSARSQLPQPPVTFVASAVTVRVNGFDYQTLPVTFRVGRYERVVVAARALDPRAVLGAADFRIETRPSVDLPPQVLREVDPNADLEATRPIAAGEVLTTYLLRSKLAVRRGDTVTLLLEGQGFRIMTLGQAAEDARRGDPVRVLNIASKREVLGTVEKVGTVRVPFLELRSGR